MKKSYIIIVIIIICIIIAALGIKRNTNTIKEENSNLKIVTSFYPLYVITLNITDGVEEISVQNMTDNTIGCLHNYTLQTADLRKVENADIFIKNGFGVETFMNKITKAYPNLRIVDTQEAGLETIQDEEGENGHVWNSIENYKKQVQYISNKLAENNPENSAKFEENTKKYIEKIDSINTFRISSEESVISCNETLAYLLNDVGFTVIPVYTDHDESSLSSGKVAEVIKLANEKNVRAIFVDKDDDLKNAELIANETNAKIIKLDSGLRGSLGKDAYINAMQENYDKIREIF